MSWRDWVALLGLALAVRLVWIVAFREMPLVSDARDYSDEAVRYMEGVLPDRPLFWPPGTAMALALVYKLMGAGVASARVLTVLVGLAWVAMTASLCRALTGKRDAALAGGTLAALYGPSVMLAGQPYSQHFAGLCLSATAIALVHLARRGTVWWAVACGLALGLGCLTRPSMLSLLPVIALGTAVCLVSAAVSRARGLALGAVVLATSLETLLPILNHNAVRGAGWVISTNNERNFFLGNNPYTPDYKTSHLGQRDLDELEPEVAAYLRSFYDRPDSRSAMRKEALRYILENPGRTAWRTCNRLMAFWGFDYLASRLHQKHRSWGSLGLLLLLALEAGPYFLVMVLCVVALALFWREMDQSAGAILLVLIAVYQAPYVLSFSAGTYHHPAMGLVLPFSGVALARALGSDGPRRIFEAARHKSWLWLAIGLFFAIQAQYAWHAVRLGGL